MIPCAQYTHNTSFRFWLLIRARHKMRAFERMASAGIKYFDVFMLSPFDETKIVITKTSSRCGIPLSDRKNKPGFCWNGLN